MTLSHQPTWVQIMLKALPIFQLVTEIVSTWGEDQVPAKHDIIPAVNAEIDSRVASGTLPADFKENIGNLVADVVALHPGVPNPPRP
jgi:hypothetical protein